MNRYIGSRKRVPTVGTHEGRTMRTIRRTLYVTLVITGLALPVAAQDPDSPPAATGDLDARWLPWMGCWQLSEEQVAAAGRGSEFPEHMVVCIAPAEDGGGATLTARGNGEVVMRRALVADGAPRDVTEGDCSGWERREWSADGRRLFTRAEIRCGTEPPRRMSGISLLLNRSTWVDIQGIAIDDRRHLEIRRYRPAQAADEQEVRLPATPRELRDARQVIAGPLTLASVREAAAKADSHVVEALLTESEPKLSLDSRTLIDLDDAGVDGSVIDLLVALAYPERFVVERRTRGGGGGGGGGWGTGWGGFGGAYAPIYYGSAMYGMYAPWGYGGYWYDPYWGRYGYGPGGGVRPDDAPEPVSQTRAIEGLGFTRVQPRTAAARGNTGDDGGAGPRTARPRGGASGGTSSGAGSGVGRSGGGTRVTSGGFTRSGGGGGGGGGGGRSGGGNSSGGGGGGRAVPRR